MKSTLQALPGVTQINIDGKNLTATAGIVPGEFDLQAAYNALEKASFPATKSETKAKGIDAG